LISSDLTSEICCGGVHLVTIIDYYMKVYTVHGSFANQIKLARHKKSLVEIAVKS